MTKNDWFLTALKNLFGVLTLGKLSLAYLEPGSSSFLLKILISSLVGLVVFFRQIWGYLRLLLNKLTQKKQATAVSQQSSKNEVK